MNFFETTIYLESKNTLEFEKKLSRHIKVRVFDYSHRLSLDDSIFLLIQTNKQSIHWQNIGTVAVWAWSKTRVEWLDIQIKDPTNRGRGINRIRLGNREVAS